jgi:hypothetical protein
MINATVKVVFSLSSPRPAAQDYKGEKGISDMAMNNPLGMALSCLVVVGIPLLLVVSAQH